MIKTTEIRAEPIVAGYHFDTCHGVTFHPYRYIWAPCLTFDAILAAFAVWAGIKHSRQQPMSRPMRFTTPQLVDILIQGNVVYFLRWAFSCHIGWNMTVVVVLSSHLSCVSRLGGTSTINGLPMLFSSAHQSQLPLVVVSSFRCETQLHTITTYWHQPQIRFR